MYAFTAVASDAGRAVPEVVFNPQHPAATTLRATAKTHPTRADAFLIQVLLSASEIPAMGCLTSLRESIAGKVGATHRPETLFCPENESTLCRFWAKQPRTYM